MIVIAHIGEINNHLNPGESILDLVKCVNCFYWDSDNSCTWEEYFDVPVWVKLTLPSKPLEDVICRAYKDKFEN